MRLWCKYSKWSQLYWCFQTVVLRRLLRVPWTTKRSNQSILKEINPEYSLEGQILKHQNFGHLLRITNSLEKKYWYWERLRAGGEGANREWDDWMVSPDSMDTSLNKLQKMVKDREAWRAAVHGITKSGTRLKWLNNNELTDLGNQSFIFTEWSNIKWSLGYCHHSSLAEYLTRG